MTSIRSLTPTKMDGWPRCSPTWTSANATTPMIPAFCGRGMTRLCGPQEPAETCPITSAPGDRMATEDNHRHPPMPLSSREPMRQPPKLSPSTRVKKNLTAARIVSGRRLVSCDLPLRLPSASVMNTYVSFQRDNNSLFAVDGLAEIVARALPMNASTPH